MCPGRSHTFEPNPVLPDLEHGWLCANLVSPSSRSLLAPQLEPLCSVHKANCPLHTWAGAGAGAAHLDTACRGRGREDSFIKEECPMRERIRFSGSSKPEIWHPFFLTLGNVGVLSLITLNPGSFFSCKGTTTHEDPPTRVIVRIKLDLSGRVI